MYIFFSITMYQLLSCAHCYHRDLIDNGDNDIIIQFKFRMTFIFQILLFKDHLFL